MKKREHRFETNVKLRGMKTPRFLIWILGWFHGKKGFISKDTAWHSNFVETKVKDYQSYSARLWLETAKEVFGEKQKILQNMAELEELEKQLDMLKVIQPVEGNLSVQQLRENIIIRDRRGMLDVRKKKIIQKIPEIKENINHIELVTEELLLDAKRKVESVLMVYFQGARKHLAEDVRIEIPLDNSSRYVYLDRKREVEKVYERYMERGE